MSSESAVADAVVLGGGPAGAAAAGLLAGWGRRVVLLARPPSRRVLAESLPPSCARLFERLGLSPALASSGFLKSTGNTTWWGRDEGRVETWPPDRCGYQVRRDHLDRLLLDWAAAAGAAVHRDSIVRDVQPAENGGRAVEYDAGGERHRIETGWVLDCTGRTGLFARRGWRRPETSARTLALVAWWERPGGWDLEHASHTLVESYGGGWAWSVPVSFEHRCVAVMLDPTSRRLGGRHFLAARYREELSRTRQMRRLLEHARPLGTAWACDASPYHAHCVAEDGILLVGDAASFVDPLSSFGVKKALASAWLAAVVTHTCIDEASMRAAALELYAAREQAMYASLQRQAASLSKEALSAHAGGFWEERARLELEPPRGEPDVQALRTDTEVLAAFETLKRLDRLQLRAAPALQRSPRPVVRGHKVAMAEHLVSPAFPNGIRWVRDVDLVRLVELCPEHDQVPDLYDAYIAANPPVALPDFLGALSLLLGKGLLGPR